jgi:hypothetical protein
MAVDNHYKTYALRYETTGMASTPALLGGISRHNLNTNTDELFDVSAGSAYPFLAHLGASRIQATFTTRNLTAALTNLGPPSKELAGIGVEVYEHKHANGQLLSGSVHRKQAIVSGIIYPRRLSVSTEQVAEFEFGVAACYDGTNNPVKETETVALASGTLADPDRYGMGALTIASVVFDKKTSVEIDFGITVDQIHADGEPWPSILDVSQQLSRVTIRGLEVENIKAAGFPITGKAFTHANTTLYFRKRSGGGYATGSDHVKMTAAGLVYVDDVLDANGNERAECSLVMLATYDGTNVPLLFTTAQSL